MKTKKHHDYRDHPCKCGKPNGVVTIRVNRNWLCTDCIHDQGWMLCGQHKSGPVWFFENSRIGCPVCARKKIADMLKSSPGCGVTLYETQDEHTTMPLDAEDRYHHGPGGCANEGYQDDYEGYRDGDCVIDAASYAALVETFSPLMTDPDDDELVSY